jgi:hypothetical protein
MIEKKKLFIVLLLSSLMVLTIFAVPTNINSHITNNVKNSFDSNPVIQVVNIKITNSQNTSTSGYQQLLNFNRTGYSNINENFSNVYFTYQNASHIYAWVQSYNSSFTSIWLKLNNINANSFIYIYANVYSKSTFLFNATGYIGEAPNINPLYNNFNKVAIKGLIQVNDTHFLTEDFSNKLNNIYYSNKSIENNIVEKITNLYINTTNLTTVVRGLRYGLINTVEYNNFSAILQQNINIKSKGIYYFNGSIFDGFNSESVNYNIFLSTKNNSNVYNLSNSGSDMNNPIFSLDVGENGSNGAIYLAGYLYGFHTIINYNNDTFLIKKTTYEICRTTNSGQYHNSTYYTSFNPSYWNFKSINIIEYEQSPLDGEPVTFNVSMNSNNLLKNNSNYNLPQSINYLPNNIMPTATISNTNTNTITYNAIYNNVNLSALNINTIITRSSPNSLNYNNFTLGQQSKTISYFTNSNISININCYNFTVSYNHKIDLTNNYVENIYVNNTPKSYVDLIINSNYNPYSFSLTTNNISYKYYHVYSSVYVLQLKTSYYTIAFNSITGYNLKNSSFTFLLSKKTFINLDYKPIVYKLNVINNNTQSVSFTIGGNQYLINGNTNLTINLPYGTYSVNFINTQGYLVTSSHTVVMHSSRSYVIVLTASGNSFLVANLEYVIFLAIIIAAFVILFAVKMVRRNEF